MRDWRLLHYVVLLPSSHLPAVFVCLSFSASHVLSIECGWVVLVVIVHVALEVKRSAIVSVSGEPSHTRHTAYRSASSSSSSSSSTSGVVVAMRAATQAECVQHGRSLSDMARCFTSSPSPPARCILCRGAYSY